MENEMILKYMAGQLTPLEKEEFEQKLASDPELRKKVDAIEETLGQFKSLNEAEIEDSYFTNLIPKVRQKIDDNGKKKVFKLVPAFSLALTVLIVLLLNLPTMDEPSEFKLSFSEDELAGILTDLDDSEIDDYLGAGLTSQSNTYSINESEDNVFDLEFENQLLAEIGLDELGAEYMTNYTIDLDDIKAEDASYIYEELINKKIL